MSRLLRGVCIGTLVTVAIGYSDLAAQGARASVRDSAGVRVLEVGRSSEIRPVIRTGSTLLQLGGLSDDPRFEFDGRNGSLTGTLRSDGGVVVADGAVLRAFGRDGSFLWTVGRVGGGPGEFRLIGWVCTFRGDSVVAHDPGLQRITYVSPSGGVIGVARTGGDAIAGCLEDGSVVVRMNEVPPLPDRRRRAHYSVLHRDGTRTNIGLHPVGMGSPISRPPPLPSGSRIHVADEYAAELRSHDVTGRLRHILRVADPPVPLSSSDFDVAIGRTVPTNASRAERTEAIARARRLREIPPVWPAIAQLKAGAAGWVWWRGQTALTWPREWTAVDATGAVRGRLREQWPSWARTGSLLSFGNDRVLMLFRDDLGAAHFVVQRLVMD